MYGAVDAEPFTEVKFSFSSKMTMTFFSVAGGVSGVPDELQIVPEGKGGPPLLEPPSVLPPLLDPPLLPPLLDPPLPLPPLPEPLLEPPPLPPLPEPLLDPPLLPPPLPEPLLDPPLLPPPLPLPEPPPLLLALPPSSLVPELGPLDPHAPIAKTTNEPRTRDVRRFIGKPFLSGRRSHLLRAGRA